MKDLISIIVPIYNSEKWLDRCIQSLLNQTYKNFEIVLINDGSTDSSDDICRNYIKKDKRIKYYKKENGGVSSARNIGLMKANGKYIKFVDSDDTLTDDCCELLLKEYNDDSIDLVICGLNVFKNDVLLRSPHLEEKKLSIHDSIDEFIYISKVFASPCNKLYKKDLIVYFNESLTAGEDLFFNLDYLKKCNNIKCISNCLYNVYLDNDNSLNRKFRDDRLDISLYLINAQIDFCNEVYGKNSYNDTFIKNRCVLNVHSYFRDVVKYKKYNDFKKVFNNYLSNQTVLWSLSIDKIGRRDYDIFTYLLKKKKTHLTYLFFKIKLLLKRG